MSLMFGQVVPGRREAASMEDNAGSEHEAPALTWTEYAPGPGGNGSAPDTLTAPAAAA